MGVRAVLFDVDGTLYWQAPLRAMMAAELAVTPIASVRWRQGIMVARVVTHYRRVHEELRALGVGDQPLAAHQIARTAGDLGLEVAAVEATVAEWMVQRPLKYLRWCRRRGLLRLLATLRANGLQLGVLSDYEPGPKLQALEAWSYFSLALCTTDSDVNALKPHPRGFLRACELWGLGPEEVLYVGDRPEVDGEGAVAAGLGCVIIGSHGTHDSSRYFSIGRLDELREYALAVN
jgi:putative hydrolase of the HAD superfamily